MKLTIIGGSGGTGAALADQAFMAGHEVTIVSRSGNTPSFARSVVGCAQDPATLGEAFTGADAVVVAVGGAKNQARNRTAVTKAVIEAMEDAGVSRLVVQSSLGAGPSARQLGPVMSKVATTMLAKPLADHNEQESAVLESGTEWTIVRPSGLTNGAATGAYRTATVEEDVTLGKSIPRSDVAAFILDVLEDPSSIGKAIGISL